MNDTTGLFTLALLQCMGVNVMLPTTTTVPLPSYELEGSLKILNSLHGSGNSFAYAGGYSQCVKDVRYYVFHSGAKPDHVPAPAAATFSKAATACYPMPSFNVSIATAGVDFIWRDMVLDCDHAYSFSKWKKECKTTDNKTVCTDYRISIPCNMTLRIWPAKGRTKYNRSLDNETEDIPFGDL